MRKKGRNYLRVVWNNMKYRCYNPKCPDYPRYGGKGVIVCQEWLNDFNAFSIWAMESGWKKGLQLDKDIKAKELGIPALLYSPEMCQIVPLRVNVQYSIENRTRGIIEYNGVSKKLSEWGKEFNIGTNTLSLRINIYKWSIERALLTKQRIKLPNKPKN